MLSICVLYMVFLNCRYESELQKVRLTLDERTEQYDAERRKNEFLQMFYVRSLSNLNMDALSVMGKGGKEMEQIYSLIHPEEEPRPPLDITPR